MNKKKRSFWRRSLPFLFATAALLQLVGCGGCGSGESGAQRTSPGIASTGGESGPAGTDKNKNLLDEIARLRAQVDALQGQIDNQDNKKNPGNINLAGCGQLNSSGQLVRCDPAKFATAPPTTTDLATNKLVRTDGSDLASGAGAAGSGSAPANSGDSSGSSLFSSASTPGGDGGGGGGGPAGGGGGGSFGSDSVAQPTTEMAKAKDSDSNIPQLPGAVSGGGGGGGGGGRGRGGGGDSGIDLSGSFGGGGAGAGLSGLSWSSLGGRAPASVSASNDPADYLTRIKPEEDIFKVVERRYTQTAMKWTQDALVKR